jgi:hypothetical protein
VERLRAKNILAGTFPELTFLILATETPATARWACSTGAAMIKGTIETAPDPFRARLKPLYGEIINGEITNPPVSS